MNLKTAFIPEVRDIEHLVSNSEGLHSAFVLGAPYASRDATGNPNPELYKSYCIRTKKFLDALSALHQSAKPLLFDHEWFSLYKMILCDDYFYNRTHDNKGKIRFSSFFDDAQIKKVFTIEEAHRFILYKSLVKDDSIIDHSRVRTASRVLYYADRLQNGLQVIASIKNLSDLPKNTRETLNDILDRFDRIHDKCDIPEIPLEYTIRSHIYYYLGLPEADDKIAFIGHTKPQKSNAPK